MARSQKRPSKNSQEALALAEAQIASVSEETSVNLGLGSLTASLHLPELGASVAAHVALSTAAKPVMGLAIMVRF